MVERQPLVEVRLPTYRRPELLRRALSSLQAQTWSNWVCHVNDDSPDDESQNLCAGLGDSRIQYHRNNPRRYAAENIDAGFERATGDASYAFVLEDDNIVLPLFIEDNIRLIGETGAQIILRNQFLEYETGRTEWGIFDARFTGGLYAPNELLVSAFFSPVISNGGLFWSREATTCLRVGHGGCGPVIQEYLRGLAIAENIYVAMEPLAVWMDNGASTTRSASPASRKDRKTELRSIQLIRQAVYDALADQDRLSLLLSDRIGSPLARREKGVREALCAWPYPSQMGIADRAKAFLRGIATVPATVSPDLNHFVDNFRLRHT